LLINGNWKNRPINIPQQCRYRFESFNAFTLSAGDWTEVNTPANGDLNFFHLANKSNSVTEKAIADSVSQQGVCCPLMSNKADAPCIGYH